MDGLARYFDSVASKRLSAVEVSRAASNQHEFNGVATLTQMFGTSGRLTFDALHFDLDAMEDGPTHVEPLTWYDARERHLTRSEWRLYYTAELDRFLHERGLLVLARRGQSVFCFTARPGGRGEHLFHELFGQDSASGRFEIRGQEGLSNDLVSAAAQVVLAELGLVPRDAPELEQAVNDRFPGAFPTGAELSAFARDNTFGIDAQSRPDVAIVAWLRVELDVFTILETRIAAVEMDTATSLDEKLAVAMRVFQRRRSRAGKALEYHLKALFDAHSVRYSHTPETENGERPDFLFPAADAYRESKFPDELLTMLASKQTLRDRWRQVLNEAARIPIKHLFTTDANLSSRQIHAMSASGVVLVVPQEIRSVYAPGQAEQMLTVSDFITLLLDRQRRVDNSVNA